MKVDNTQYHLTIAGKILVILGVLAIPFSVFSWGALSFFWNSDWFYDNFHHGWDSFHDGWFIWPWNFFYLLPGFYFLTSVLFIICGVGLVNQKDWAKRLVWVPAVLLLFKFPIGTALGVWIIYLLQKEKQLHYPTRSSSK